MLCFLITFCFFFFFFNDTATTEIYTLSLHDALPISETVPSPSRIGLDLIGIDEGAPLKLDLRIESVSEGVLVSGTVSAPTTGECARCLTSITGDVEIDLTELFAYPDSATDETTESDEIGRVIDDTVDLEQPIIDAIGLALPF